jgi:hypothetical protein
MKNIDLAGPYFFHTIYENFGSTPPKVILSNNQILYSSLDTSEYNFFDFYDQCFKNYYFDKLKEPHMILTGAFTMPYLENLQYDQQTVDFLNNHGLHIYLFEILHFDFGRRKSCLIDMFDKNPGDISYNDLTLHFSLNEDNIDDLYSFELESISNFVKNNKLTNVIVFTNENLTADILQTKYPIFKIETLDILCKGWRSQLDIPAELEPLKIKKHFWSGNWRYDAHRHIASAFLIDKNCNLSFIHKKSIDDLLPKLWFDLSNWELEYPSMYKTVIKGLEDLQDKAPISFDQLPMCPSRKTVPACPSGFPLPVESYTDSFCCVLTESKFAYPFPCFSEKVTNAILCGRPFIILAPPNTLKYIKSLGFKTFDNWWSEEYDEETDHETRLVKIFRLIEKLNNLEIEDCRELYRQMMPTLEHNINQLDIIKN